LAAPLFLLEVGRAGAFVAFLISGGMFAVSIPTNVVIGMRLRRDTRASAMGIAVGVLMGSQALGAAMGGVAASWVGPPTAIGGALALAAGFSLWSFVTTPHEAKHLARPRRSDQPPAEAHSVIDLTTLEAEVGPLGRTSAHGELASAV
jgi:predicted MFS family arabinose efflux permease